MPWLGVTLCSLWFFTLFVVRSLIQWINTGSIGLNGFRGAVGSLEWSAGVCATTGLILAPLSPVATIAGWPNSSLYFAEPSIHVLGATIGVAGIAGGVMAQLAMGDSWRIGVDTAERTKLVTGGLFGWVRNPIFTFIGVSLFGFFLTVPNHWSAIAMILTAIGIQLQVRFVEEPYLREVHGDAYRDYTAAVGRFVPGVGRVDLT